MLEKNDVRRVLPRDALADRAMAGVIVDGVAVGTRMNVLATAGIFL
jgi:hypothetical protein